jgi:hypothetical protein
LQTTKLTTKLLLDIVDFNYQLFFCKGIKKLMNIQESYNNTELLIIAFTTIMLILGTSIIFLFLFIQKQKKQLFDCKNSKNN